MAAYNKPKAIRLGEGIENRFVLLTHLRYQFRLLSNDARENERTRMVRIFTQAIRDRRVAVPAANMFALRT